MRSADRMYSGLPAASILVMPKSSAMKSGSCRSLPDWSRSGACTARSSHRLAAANASSSSSGNRVDARFGLIRDGSLEMRPNGAFEHPLGAQNEFAHFAHGAMAAARARDVMGALAHRFGRRRHGGGKTAAGDERQVEQSGYMGDDLLDLPLITRCGFAATVAAAPEAVRKRAHYVARTGGGHGAVREVCEFILRAQGMLERAIGAHLQ